MIAIVNGSECYVPFACLDTAGVAFTPSSISYQVWDTTNDVLVAGPTSVSPAQSGTIVLDATINSMNAASGKVENRAVTVKIGIPGGTFQNLTAQYALIRAAGTP